MPSLDPVISNMKKLVHYCKVEPILELFVQKNIYTQEKINSLFSSLDRNTISNHNKRLFFFDVSKTGLAGEFIDCLEETSQIYLAKVLKEKLISRSPPKVIETHKLKKTPSSISVFRQGESSVEAGVDIVDSKTVLGNLASDKPLIIKVSRSKRFHDVKPQRLDCYPTRSKSRASVLIINNYDFENPRENPYRNGALVDQKNLKTMFHEMGFEVEPYENLTKKQMEEVIQKFTSESHKTSDICFAFIMSHGKENNSETFIAGTDDKFLSASQIESRFSNRNCKVFKDKPKIIIYQVCRGDLIDNIYLAPSPVEFDSTYHGTDTTSVQRGFSDMLIGHSTIMGYKAHRDVNRGTWYIESLCDIFMRHAHDIHVEDMLKKVDKRLSKFCSEMGGVQTSTYTNMGFQKYCYLHPGIYEEDGHIREFHLINEGVDEVDTN